MPPYRVQMTYQHQIVADELFDSFAEAEDFTFWWMRQDDLPNATALQARADVDGPRWHLPPSVELNYTLEPHVRERFTASRERHDTTRRAGTERQEGERESQAKIQATLKR